MQEEHRAINILSPVAFPEVTSSSTTTTSEWLPWHFFGNILSHRARQHSVVVTLPAVFQVLWRAGGACQLKRLILP